MNSDEYRRFDATGLATLVRNREVSAHELLDQAIERADATDDALSAITVDDEDFARARLETDLKGPLAGVPFLFKDLYTFLKGTTFTNGSRLTGDFNPVTTSTFVQRCLDTGLVPFGKTKSPEFGVNVVTEPLRFGPCRNPWDLSRSPGGSSGGAGAAVAAGIVPMAHATDGGGSIRIPASHCGLFGLKPSRARTPVGPFVGEAWNGLAGGHVLTRSVRDCALMLDLIGGPERGDAYSCAPPPTGFLNALQQTPKPLRIGLWTQSLYGTEIAPDCLDAAQSTAKLLADLGHEVTPIHPKLDGERLRAANLAVIFVNMANDLDFWAGVTGKPLTDTHVERITLALAERGRAVTGQEFAQALSIFHTLSRQFGKLFDEVDLLLTPTMGGPPPLIGTFDQNSEDVDHYLDLTTAHIPFTPLYNMSGCPAVSVPLHWNADGLPVGAMLGAALGHEHVLLQVCRQLEEARPWFDRYPPAFNAG